MQNKVQKFSMADECLGKAGNAPKIAHGERSVVNKAKRPSEQKMASLGQGGPHK